MKTKIFQSGNDVIISREDERDQVFTAIGGLVVEKSSDGWVTPLPVMENGNLLRVGPNGLLATIRAANRRWRRQERSCLSRMW